MQTPKHPPRPSLLLKDHLRDDLSSCSSSGFKSFPRRQCCTAVRFLPEKDLQRKRQRKKPLLRPSSCSTTAALQRASEAVINAFKSLPFPSQKSTKAKKADGLLSRSLSRELLSRSFWRKAAKEEGSDGTPRGRTSFREFLLQEPHNKPTSSHENTTFSVPNSTTSSASGSNSWAESEFTCSSSASSSGSSTENDVVVSSKVGAPQPQKIEDSMEMQGVTTGDWPNEEKEQFSPVSVLDCQFDENDEETTSAFDSTTRSRLEGTEHKHTEKRRPFVRVASLEPVDLQKRIAYLELENEPYNHFTKHCSVSEPIMCTQNGSSNVLRDHVEENERNLLSHVKRSVPSNCLIIEAENLLFDYFKQSLGENSDLENSKKRQYLCKVAEDWMRGQPQEVYLGWEVKEGRQIYIREMDKRGERRNSGQEIQRLVQELEYEVFTGLVNELVLDLTMC